MLALCAALRWELAPLLRAWGPVDRLRAKGIRVWQARHTGQPIIFRTGVGVQAAAEATAKALAEFPVTAVINTGCAGGLVPSAAAGTLVIATSVTEADGQRTRYDVDSRWVDRLRETGQRAGLSLLCAPLLTSRVPLGSPATKREAHRIFDAVAVDMEGSSVARASAGVNVPFASARFVLDPADLDITTLLGGASVEPRTAGLATPALRAHLQTGGVHRNELLRGALLKVEEGIERLCRGLRSEGPRSGGWIDD